MPSRCSICSSPLLAEISDFLDSNSLTLKEIAAQFHCSYPSLVRHAARHRDSVATESGSAGSAGGGDLQNKSDLLWSRSNEVWNLAAADTDLRSQISSIQTGLRSLELQAKQWEREQEAASEEKGLFDENGRLDVRVLTEVSDWYDRTLSETQKRTITKAAELERELGVSDGFALFETMRTDPILREAVLEFAHNFQLARKEKNENELESIQAISTPN
jgi:hypothetical protein